MSRGWKIVIGIAVFVLAVNLGERALRSVTGTPGGPDDSSYATGSTGAAAYAELLSDAGHRVRQLRTPPSKTRLAPGETAVLLGPPYVLRPDQDALERFLRRGGRLIAGGGDGLWMRRFVRGLTAAGAVVNHAVPLAPVPEVAGVATVAQAGTGSWIHLRVALPVLGRGGVVTAAVAQIGRGRIVLLADPSPLENAYLAKADDARLALDLAGARSRPVVFFESYHGYGSSSGVGAVPARWLWLLGLLGLAWLVYTAARWRRLGPPEAVARPFPPARVEYVEALAGTLQRTRDPEALAALKAEVVRRSRRRGAAGLTPEEEAAVARSGIDGQDVLPLGRALARLAGQRP